MATQSNVDEHEKAIIQADDEYPNVSNIGWKILFGFTTKKHVPILLGAFLSASIAASTPPAFAIVYGLVFRAYADYGAGKTDSESLLVDVMRYCVLLSAVTSLSWIANSACFFLFLTFGELQARSARNRIFEALTRQDMTWFDTRKTGIAALLPVIQMHVRDLQLSLSIPFGEGVQCIMQALGTLCVAFYYSWSLTLAIICTSPLIYLIQAFLSTRLSIRAQQHANMLQHALKYVTSAMQNIETVKSFNGERHELQNSAKLISRCGILYNRVANLRSVQIGVMQFFALCVFFQAFWYGSHLIKAGDRNVEQVITTFWAALAAIQSIAGFLPQYIVLQKGQIAGARLGALMRRISTIDAHQEMESRLKPTQCLGDIEFRRVTFSYPTRTDATALREVSLFFPAGETTFIIGKSGSGKSTLGQLLVRFYPPSCGQIYLDGIELGSLDLAWLRSNITLVEQDSTIFNDTIHNNITMSRGNEAVSLPEIQDVSKFAMLESIAQDLPTGLDTQLGMQGNSLSGGEKQRIALARAKFRNSPVLILDESTCALDYRTKAAIIQAIRKWRKGKTTIIITHDIAQIQADDYVYLVDDGHLVQEGYRTELEAHPGAFQSFLATHAKRQTYRETKYGELSPLGNASGRMVSIYGEFWSPYRSVYRPLSTLLLFGRESDVEEPKVVSESLPIMEIFKSVWLVLEWRTRSVLLAAVFCTILHSAATPAFAWFSAKLLTTFFDPQDQTQQALSFALAILSIAIVDGIACYLMFFLSDVVAQSWTVKLKTEAMRRIVQQPREFFDRKDNGLSRLAETLDHSAEEARNLPGRFACVFLVVFLMITISIFWSLVTSWKLAVVALATSPILYGITKVYNMITSHWERLANEAGDQIGEVLHETFTNIRTVQCLTLEDHFRRKFKQKTAAAIKIGVKRALYSGSIFGLNYAGVLFIAVLLFWYGAVLIASNQYSVGEVLETFLILMLSINHIVYMSNYMTQVNISRNAGSRLLRLARLPTTSHELIGSKQILEAGDISFHRVTFAYPSRRNVLVLRDVSFHIPRGSCTAIIGPSGSGKSTIAALLLKLYKPESYILSRSQTCKITISDHDIHTLDTTALRSRIAIVSQTPVLFPGTIAENIAYGLPSSSPLTTMENIRAAAEAAGVSEFINSLSRGYQTLIGEGHTSLSGGQAQRIAIARALLRQPDVLILDEATSALDVISASLIRDTIRSLREGNATEHPSTPTTPSSPSSSGEPAKVYWLGKDSVEVMPKAKLARRRQMACAGARKRMTVIIITHAEEMMAIADHIIMLDKGRVVEQGSFTDLKRKRSGPFGRLLRGERERRGESMLGIMEDKIE